MTAAKTLAYRFPYRLGKMAILLAIVAFVGVHTVLTHRMVMEMLIARDGAVDPLSLSLLQAMAGLAALLALGVIGAILYRGALSLHLSDSGVEVRRLARPPLHLPWDEVHRAVLRQRKHTHTLELVSHGRRYRFPLHDAAPLHGSATPARSSATADPAAHPLVLRLSAALDARFFTES